MNSKHTLIAISAIVALIALFLTLALNDVGTSYVKVLGDVFLLARVCIYISAFFIYFESVTVPGINKFMRNEDYAERFIRPKKYRILTWIVVFEVLLFTSGK